MVLPSTTENVMSDFTYTENLTLAGIVCTWDVEISISACSGYWYPVCFVNTDDTIINPFSPEWGRAVSDFYDHTWVIDCIDDRVLRDYR